MPGQRGGFLAAALHQAAVAGDRVGVVIDDLGAEARGEHPFGQRHADGVGEALAERPGGGLDPGRMADLGVARRAALELPEVLYVLDTDRAVADRTSTRLNSSHQCATRMPP